MSERRERFGARARERLGDVLRARDRADAAPAAARDCFDHHRAAVAERREERGRAVEVDFVVAAGEHGDVQRARQRACARFVAEQLQHVGPRADERQPRLDAALRELGVLAQKAVAGMDSVAARYERGGDTARVDVEIRRADRKPRSGIASSAMRTCSDSASSRENTATVAIPSDAAARATRTAISPRFAMRSRVTLTPLGMVPGLPSTSILPQTGRLVRRLVQGSAGSCREPACLLGNTRMSQKVRDAAA